LVTEFSASTGALVKIISGSSYRFDAPDTIASYGTHIWVVNDGDSVTELSASTGALAKIISGSTYRFDGPSGITAASTHIWVANTNGQSVTEFPAP
jgi:hypothetical protein